MTNLIRLRPLGGSLLNLLVLTISLCFVGLGGAGCQTHLAPGGVYAGDTTLYDVDNTLTTSHAILQQFVDWEANHRTALAQWPQIKQLADQIVDEGPGWYTSAFALRDSYKIEPTQQNKDKLLLAIRLIRTAVTEASSHIQVRSPKIKDEPTETASPKVSRF